MSVRCVKTVCVSGSMKGQGPQGKYRMLERVVVRVYIFVEKRELKEAERSHGDRRPNVPKCLLVRKPLMLTDCE